MFCLYQSSSTMVLALFMHTFYSLSYSVCVSLSSPLSLLFFLSAGIRNLSCVYIYIYILVAEDFCFHSVMWSSTKSFILGLSQLLGPQCTIYNLHLKFLYCLYLFQGLFGQIRIL